jgi:hypothetical protein
LKLEHSGYRRGADTVWGTVYVQRDDELRENAVDYRRCPKCQSAAIAGVPRQIEFSYRPCARVRARFIPPRQHRPSWASSLGPLWRGSVVIDAEVDRYMAIKRALLRDGGDPPRPAEETLRCVRAPRRTEWIPARRVGILRPCAVPVAGGTSRLHKRLCMPCQPAPNSGNRQSPAAELGPDERPSAGHTFDYLKRPMTGANVA